MSEPVFVGSFPAFSQTSTKTFSLVGALPPGHELRELQVVIEYTLRSNVVGAGTVVALDHQTLQNAFLAKLRMSFYGQNDVYNLTPDEARAIAIYAKGRDPAPEFLRVGATIPGSGSAVLPTKSKFIIPFTQRGLEMPEMFAPSTDQGNLPNSKIDIDTTGTQLTATLTVGGVVVNIVVTDVKVFAILAPVQVSHVGPLMLWRSKTIVAVQDVETGMALDLLVADERVSSTVEVQVTQISVIRDNRMSPRNVSPTHLAQHFGETQFPYDGVLPVDLTTNGIGFQITPSIWIAGDIRATEWQWPVWVVQRIYYQNLASGGSPNATLLFWQVRPFPEVQANVVQLVNQFQIGLSSLDQLAVRGGGASDNDINKLFKGRFLQKAA